MLTNVLFKTALQTATAVVAIMLISIILSFYVTDPLVIRVYYMAIFLSVMIIGGVIQTKTPMKIFTEKTSNIKKNQNYLIFQIISWFILGLSIILSIEATWPDIFHSGNSWIQIFNWNWWGTWVSQVILSIAIMCSHVEL